MFAESQVLHIRGELQERDDYHGRWKEYIQEFLNEDHSKEEIQTFVNESKAALESAWQEHHDCLRDFEIIFSRRYGGMTDEVYWLLVKDQYIYQIWRRLEEIFEASFQDERDGSIAFSLDVSERSYEDSDVIIDLEEDKNIMKERSSNISSMDAIHTHQDVYYVAETFLSLGSVGSYSLNICELPNADSMCSINQCKETVSLFEYVSGYDSFGQSHFECFQLFFLHKWIDEACAWLRLLRFLWLFMHFSRLEGHLEVILFQKRKRKRKEER
jgi:hypothetical protein